MLYSADGFVTDEWKLWSGVTHYYVRYVAIVRHGFRLRCLKSGDIEIKKSSVRVSELLSYWCMLKVKAFESCTVIPLIFAGQLYRYLKINVRRFVLLFALGNFLLIDFQIDFYINICLVVILLDHVFLGLLLKWNVRVNSLEFEILFFVYFFILVRISRMHLYIFSLLGMYCLINADFDSYGWVGFYKGFTLSGVGRKIKKASVFDGFFCKNSLSS